MSLREKQQMNLDTERAQHTGMECQTKSSPKYLLLQVWCGLLTVAIVVMAVFLTSIKPKSTQDEVPAPKPFVSPPGSSLSYIQLHMSVNAWQASHPCDFCALRLHNNSIHCMKDSHYFIYAQVAFSKHKQKAQKKSVILIRDDNPGRRLTRLVEGTFVQEEGSVWVAKIVSLKKGDSLSINITGDFLKDTTFWGAFQLC